MPKAPKTKSAFNHNQLYKCPTGIKGFDAITEGGLPKNRTTLFCGNTKQHFNWNTIGCAVKL